ncbi:Hypothetical protein AJAP_07305 [Amycolatopsis japonica]|uniref:Uncharacterized protein n=1 Tax=Amycolatopsis japonica TaxID=208439 RepID=A0A075UPB1_9PSEU|nr:Hypothetical protein AJAP_07305 [Amycolatopsis japonica]
MPPWPVHRAGGAGRSVRERAGYRRLGCGSSPGGRSCRKCDRCLAHDSHTDSDFTVRRYRARGCGRPRPRGLRPRAWASSIRSTLGTLGGTLHCLPHPDADDGRRGGSGSAPRSGDGPDGHLYVLLAGHRRGSCGARCGVDWLLPRSRGCGADRRCSGVGTPRYVELDRLPAKAREPVRTCCGFTSPFLSGHDEHLLPGNGLRGRIADGGGSNANRGWTVRGRKRSQYEG